VSAIFGLVHWGGQPPDPDGAELMSAALAAHGPDGGSIWRSQNVVFGQKLMCFTPEDRLEKQPALSTSGQHIIVTDARLDNRIELAEALGISHQQAREMPDSAFILRAYEKWGIDCPEHLLGDSVFAVFDRREQRVLLTRSPLGKRSLYYHHGPSVFAFASAPKALFALPWIPREIDPKGLADYLVMAPPEPGRSLYLQVSRLKAGHSLILRRGSIESRQYWQPDMKGEIRFSRDSEYVDAFNSLIERAVSNNLRSSSQVGVMMSGGFDSTAVAAVASDQLQRGGKRLPAFTEVPGRGFHGAVIKGRYADETPLVRAMAAMYPNLDLKLISTDGGFYLDDVDRFFDAAEGPFPAASNRVWMEAIIRQASAEKTNVLLTGTAGNNTISWAGRGLLGQLIRRWRWKAALGEVRAIARRRGARCALRTVAGSVSSLLPDWAWIPLRMVRMGDAAPHRPWVRYTAARPEFIRAQQVETRARQRGASLLPRVGTDTRALRYDAFLSFDIISDIERGFETLYRVQLRDPTADLNLVEFCLSLPEEQYSRGGTSRRLIRTAMADRLPREILDNPLRGLQAADWFDRLAGARERLRDDLTRFEGNELVRNALDLSRLRALLKEMGAGGGDAESIARDYRSIFERGMMTGRFLLWFESGGRPFPASTRSAAG